jgi:hypothetical protein
LTLERYAHEEEARKAKAVDMLALPGKPAAGQEGAVFSPEQAALAALLFGSLASFLRGCGCTFGCTIPRKEAGTT